jgi:seryl-tRNA synthetase
MLDIKLIRNEPERVREALRRRGEHAESALDKLLELDRSRREVLVEVEEKRSLRNAVSEQIAQAQEAKQDASDKIAAMREVARRSRNSTPD